jgi:uncharacterized protein (TIGR00369 family)
LERAKNLAVYRFELRGEISLAALAQRNMQLQCTIQESQGGASCVLAEELGSTAAMLCLDSASMAVGLEINANHVRGVFEGIVTGTARPLHLGRTTQIWEIRIEDEQQRLVCISRLTVAVIAKPPGAKYQ